MAMLQELKGDRREQRRIREKERLGLEWPKIIGAIAPVWKEPWEVISVQRATARSAWHITWVNATPDHSSRAWSLCWQSRIPGGEWHEVKASLGGLLFCRPGGAEEFSPGFQPWETSSMAVRPHKEHGGITRYVGGGNWALSWL
jgi:hypothetical protein